MQVEIDWSSISRALPPAQLRPHNHRFSPKVKKWLKDRNLLFAQVRNDVQALYCLNPQYAGKLMDDVPEILEAFHEFDWSQVHAPELFAEFVKRGCRFRVPIHVRSHVHLGPIVIDALGRVPYVHPNTPFIAEILEKFGPWHEQFDHPIIERIRNERRLAVLRRAIVDGDGAISARVKTFLE